MKYQELFTFDGYDCIGFDLDSTLVEYDEQEMVKLIYNVMATELVNGFKYDAAVLLKPLSADIDFLQKGLILDVKRGNIMSIADDGTILRAYHGTRALTDPEIDKIYASDRKLNTETEYCGSTLKVPDGVFSTKITSLLDCFDVYLTLLFARVIDAIDKKTGSPLTAYSCWPHILQAIHNVEQTEDFVAGTGEFFFTLQSNPDRYIKKRSSKFLSWLDSLKKLNKITFVVTCSEPNFADFVGEHAMGADWKKYFDVIVYDSRKPGFFEGNHSFLSVGGNAIVSSAELKIGNNYEQGNWAELRQLFAKVLNKEDAKSVYIGDHLLQDVYTPSKLGCCDTVAVVKALVPECEERNNTFFTSKAWGSIFYDSLLDKRTMWGYVVEVFSKVCIPNLEWFVDEDLRKKYEQLKQI